MLQAVVATHPNARTYTSLGQLRYLSCIAHCDGVVGNSSSGLLEAPTFRKGTVNVGDRQRGRLMTGSVINCRTEKNDISRALKKLYSSSFQASLRDVSNPYGEGGASARIIGIIKELRLERLVQKVFYDLPSAADRRPGASW